MGYPTHNEVSKTAELPPSENQSSQKNISAHSTQRHKSRLKTLVKVYHARLGTEPWHLCVMVWVHTKWDNCDHKGVVQAGAPTWSLLLAKLVSALSCLLYVLRAQSYALWLAAEPMQRRHKSMLFI